MPPAATAIVWPLLAQVILTAVVWLALYVARLGEIKSRQLDPQTFRNSRTTAGVLENVAAADNFRNLFEVPVLFFTAGALIAAVGRATTLELVLAWTFVGLRALHSLIHVTYNRVVHRFAVYATGTVVVFALWGALAWDLARVP